VNFTSKKIPLYKLHPLAKKVARQSHLMRQAMAYMLTPHGGGVIIKIFDARGFGIHSMTQYSFFEAQAPRIS
jgi:hypothetical protein